MGRDGVLLSQVMEWCEAKDHAGVRGEASRLLAALIRHSRSPVSLFISSCSMFTSALTYSFSHQELVHAVARADGIQHLISMATSEHVIMQNEALVALAIAAAIDIGTAPSHMFQFGTARLLRKRVCRHSASPPKSKQSKQWQWCRKVDLLFAVC